MKLAIITDSGTVFEVIDGLEEYDLSKPLARSHVADEIRDEIERILKYEPEYQ